MDNLPKISPEIIKAYQEKVAASGSPATAKRKMSSLKKFFDWTNQEGITAIAQPTRQDNPVYNQPAPRLQLASQPSSEAGSSRFVRIGILVCLVIIILLLGTGVAIFVSNRNEQIAKIESETTKATILSPWTVYAKLGLKDKSTSNQIIFKLYTDPASASPVWTSPVTSATADANGNSLISLDNVPTEVFFENEKLYLGADIAGADQGVRIPISTANTAANLNSYFPADPEKGAEANMVPVLSKDGALLFAGESPAIAAPEGNLLVEGQAVTIMTPTASDGDITLNPDGSGNLNLIFEGNRGKMINATAPNLTSGSLYYGYVGNNSSNYDLINLQSGSSATTQFSVDAKGNTDINGELNVSGNINTDQNIQTSDVTRLTATGALTNITGYSQTSGNFSIVQRGGETATITKTGTALSDVLTLTLDERGKPASSNSIYSTLTLNRYDGAVEAMALFVDNGNVRFDGQTQVGRYTSNPTSIGSGTIIFNTGDNTLYLWNGSSWVALGGGSTSGFWNRTSGVVHPLTITDDLAIGGTDSSAPFYVDDSGNVTIDGNTALGDTSADTITFNGVAASTLDMNTNVIANIGNAGTDFDTSGGLTLAANLAVNGGGVTSTGDLTISPTGGDIIFADNAVLNIGGSGSDVAYNVIGDSTAGASANMNSDNDLYIEGNLEVDGTIFGTVSATDLTCTDCLDFVDFEDTLDVDAATDINLGAFALTIDMDSTGDFSIRDGTTDIATFTDSGAITFAPTTALVDITGDLDVSDQGAFGSAGAITAGTTLFVDNVFTDTSGSVNAGYFISEAEPGSASTGVYRGVLGEARLDTVSGATALNAVQGSAIVNAAGTVAVVRGGLFASTIADTVAGIAPSMMGVQSTVDAEDGTVTNAYGAFIDTPSVDTGSLSAGYGLYVNQGTKGAGTYTTQTGILIEPMSNATSNNYGIWGDAGDWILDEDGDGAAGGTTGGGDIILGEGQDLELYHDGTDSYIVNNTGALNINTTTTATIDAATDIILDADGADIFFKDAGTTIATFTNSSTDLNIDVAGGQLMLADTDVFNIGGVSALVYNALSNSGGAAGSASIDTDNDLYIQGSLEVDGASQFDGGVTVSDLTCTDCLDFTEFEDTLDLDAALILNQTTNTWTQSFTGTTGPGFSYTASGAVTSGNAAALDIQVTNASTSVPAVMISNAGSSYALRVNDDGTTTDSTPFVIDAAGQVGIGDSTPEGKLDVDGAITGQALVQFNETGDQAIFTASASGTPRFTIDRADTTINGQKDITSIAALADEYVYDTTRDPDGGTWRNDERAKASSWYNETLDHTGAACVIASDDRCGRREFPEKAILVLSSSNLYIYDARDNTMWMRFAVTAGGVLSSSVTPNRVFALNGKIYIAQSSTNGGLYFIDFLTEKGGRYQTATDDWRGTRIADRNTNQGFVTSLTYSNIASSAVNDVYAVMVGGKTYIAGATDGGANGSVSLINETDRTVANLGPASVKSSQVFMTRDGTLYAAVGDAGTPTNYAIKVKYNAPSASGNNQLFSAVYGNISTSNYGATTTDNNTFSSLSFTAGPAPIDATFIVNSLWVTSGTSTVDGKSNVIYAASNDNLLVINEKQGDESNGSAKYYNTTYITEDLTGDIRGMWPFAESAGGNGAIADATIKAGKLTSKGSPTFSVSGVRGTAITFDQANSDYLCSETGAADGTCDDDSNFDTTTGSISVGAWIKRSASGTDQDTVIGKFGNAAGDDAFAIFLNSSNSLIFRTNSANNTTGITISDTNWHFVVGVFDNANNTQYLYLDGNSLGSTAQASDLNDSSVALTIGADLSGAANAAANFFRGTIDGPFVTSEVLAPGQIRQMFIVGTHAKENHTASRIIGMATADNYQKLQGSVNLYSAVTVDSGNRYIYIGSDDASAVTGTGALSVVGIDSDTVTDLYSATNTTKLDDSAAAWDGNDVVAVSVAGSPSHPYNAGSVTNYQNAVIAIAGKNSSDTNKTWMEMSDLSLYGTVAQLSGPNLNKNTMTVNNMFQVYNTYNNLASSTTGEIIETPAFSVDAGGNLNYNYLGGLTSATAMTLSDAVLTSGTDLSLTGSALTTGTGIAGTFNALTSGKALSLSSSATAFTGNLVDLTLSGSNAANTGSVLSVTNSGTANTGTTLYVKHYATGTNNIAFRVDDVSGDTTPFVIDGAGAVAIGNAAPAANMSLDVDGRVQINLGGTQTSVALCGSHASGGTATESNVEIVDCTGTPGADYMEMYSVEPDAQPGEIVVVGDETVVTNKGDQLSKLVRSTTAYQANVVGIISNPVDAGDFNSVGYNINEEDNPMPVALAGRVKVKIASDSAPIAAGDFITTSGEPGRAMKASDSGYVVGRALEDWNPPAAPGEPSRQVMVFVGLGYRDAAWALNDTGEFNITKNITPLATLANYSLIRRLADGTQVTVKQIGTFGQAVIANLKAGFVEATEIKSPIIETAVISPIPDQDLTIDLGNSKLVVKGDATFSGQLTSDNIITRGDEVLNRAEIEAILKAAEENQTLLANTTSNSVLTATDSAKLNEIVAENLYVTNTAAISALSITNSISVGSDFVIQASGIDTLSLPLKIQSLAMAPIEIMGALVKIDTKGNVWIGGDLNVAGAIATERGFKVQESGFGKILAEIDASGSAIFKDVTTEKLIIAGSQASASATLTSASSETNATAGRAIIAAGAREITIKNPKVTDYTLVYVTPISSTDNKVLYVKSKLAGSGFVVGFEEPTAADVEFNWWIIDVAQ